MLIASAGFELGSVRDRRRPLRRSKRCLRLEFALEALKINDMSGGCDLRPMDPVRKERDGLVLPKCNT